VPGVENCVLGVYIVGVILQRFKLFLKGEVSGVI